MQFRRPSGSQPITGVFETVAGRRLLWQMAIVLALFVVGYLITVFWLFPAPLFHSEHSVPRVLDLGVTQARERLESQGLRFRVEDQVSDPTVPKGAVIWQDPPPGVVIEPNTQVSLTLSDGPPDLPVPDVGGFPRPLAEKVMRAAGFTVGKPESLPSLQDPGTVVQTRPGPGVARPAGTEIDLVISAGPAELSVPGVLGLPLAEARDRIEAVGLVVGSTTSRFVAGRPEGIVLDQHPPAGTRSPRGGRVDLVLTRKGS
jgi:beta-lactam-binding protein with PASTA domain